MDKSNQGKKLKSQTAFSKPCKENRLLKAAHRGLCACKLKKTKDFLAKSYVVMQEKLALSNAVFIKQGKAGLSRCF